MSRSTPPYRYIRITSGNSIWGAQHGPFSGRVVIVSGGFLDTFFYVYDPLMPQNGMHLVHIDDSSEATEEDFKEQECLDALEIGP